MRNGVGYLSVVGAPVTFKRGLMPRALGHLIDYLFENWPFRKFYFESVGPSFREFSSGLGSVFEEEGRLKEFEYSSSGYLDVHVCAISRSRWAEVRPVGDTIQTAFASRALLRAKIPRDLPVLDLDGFLEVLASTTGGPRTPDERLSDIPLDSLGVLEIVCALEELAGLSFDEGDYPSQGTIRDWYLKYCEKASEPLP